MITQIEALNFRCLRSVSHPVARFQALVGPNGSGKSTFLDVVAFLGDLLKVGPLKAIVGDGNSVAPRAANPAHLAWMGEEHFEVAVEADIPPDRLNRLPDARYRRVRYEVSVRVGGQDAEVALASETLWLLPAAPARAKSEPTFFPMTREPRPVVREPSSHAPKGWRKVVNKIASSGNDYFHAETSGWNNPFRLGPTKSALANLPEDEERFPAATWMKRFLMEGVQRVALKAEAIRRPSPPGSPRGFLPDGSNLPWMVEGLAGDDPDRFRRWVDHLRTALPDIRSVRTTERPEDRHRYVVVQYANGFAAPSWVVSDGTLRLLALTLLAYVPRTSGVFLIEEPENGVHPRAVETVFQSLSAVVDAQVLCASHSPVVLGLARLKDLL